MSTKKKPSPESIVREIKRKTRRKYSAEEIGRKASIFIEKNITLKKSAEGFVKAIKRSMRKR